MTERLGAIKFGDGQRRAVPGPRHRPPAQLLRGRRRDRRRGGQEAHRRRPPGGVRHPGREPRRARRPGPRAAREGDPRQGGGRRGLRAAAAPARAPGLDRLARPRAVDHPAGRRCPQEIRDRVAANGSPSRPRSGRRRRRDHARPASGGDVHGDPRPSGRCRLPDADLTDRRDRPDRLPDRDPADVPAFDHARAEAAVRELLIAIGEDPDREGLHDTPARVARAYAEMTAGLRQTAEDVLTTTFDIGHDEMVLVRDIELWSMCEHHLVPFTGRRARRLHPGRDGKITGLSKLARLVDVYAKRPAGAGAADHPGRRRADGASSRPAA